jgi:2-methylcitrate dehydratase PrpD
VTALAELAGWASKLTLEEVPKRVVRWATSQVLSQLAAVRAGRAHPIGAALVEAFGPPLQADPGRSACVLAGLGSWLRYDDNAYAGHLSTSTVTVALAYAYHYRLSGRELLTAVIAANECAARITAAAALGASFGQTATHTPLAGAVAARLRCESAPAQHWVDAFGLALSLPPLTIGPGVFGSDAKALSTFVPVRIGLDACDAATAGLVGLADILEHPQGLPARLAMVPLPAAATEGLGALWHTETLSFKLYPSGPGSDAAVDCAIELHQALGADVDALTEVVVHASLYTLVVDRGAAAHIRGPDTPTVALVLWTPYLVATALLTGDLTPADFSAAAVRDQRRWTLADKIRVVHDPDLTRSACAGTAPFGQALREAGPRAADWLRAFGAVADGCGDWLADLADELGPPEPTFESAYRSTGARIACSLADGRLIERSRTIPAGTAGPHTRAHHPALVRRKFLATGGSPAVADKVLALDQAPPDQVAEIIETALADT